MLQKFKNPTVSLWVIFFFSWAILSCGSEGANPSSAADSRESIASIQINPDPLDFEVAILTAYDSNDQLVIYGEKDEDGDVVQVQTIQYISSEADDPWNIKLNDLGHPSFISMSDGNLEFKYWGDNVTVEYRDIDGNIYIEDFSMEDVVHPSTTDNQLDRAAVGKTANRAFESSIIRKETVVGNLNTFLVDPGDDDDPESTGDDIFFCDTDAHSLYVQATDHKGVEKSIQWHRNEKGKYEFNIPLWTANLDVTTKQCKESKGFRDKVAFSIAIAMSVVAMIASFGATTALQAQAAAVLFTIEGVSGSSAAYINQWDCRELMRKGFSEMGIGQQTVYIRAFHHNRYYNKKVSYDLFDNSNPIANTKRFKVELSFHCQPRFLDVSTTPVNPKPGQNYVVNVVAILPNGGSIDFDWERWDREDDGDSPSATETGIFQNTSDEIYVSHTFENKFPGSSKAGAWDTFNLKLYTIEKKQRVLRCETLKRIDIEPPIPTKGLVVYYPFNGNADDESGNGYDATVFGAQLTEDRFGNAESAYYFSGGDHIHCLQLPEINDKLSLVVWFKTGHNYSEEEGHILGTASGSGFFIDKQSDANCINAYLETGYNDWNQSITSRTYNDNQWHMAAVTYSGSRVNAYIDGQRYRTVADTGELDNDTYGIWMGKLWAGTIQYFYGLIDDAIVYDRVLSNSEILALYNYTETQ